MAKTTSPPQNGKASDHLSAASARRLASLAHALGPEIGEALSNPKVTDLLLNADGNLWCEEHGKPRRILARMSPAQAESVIRLLASHMGAEVTRERPLVSGVLPGTIARFQGVLPPISKRPIFAIRKHSEVIYTLDDFVRDEILSPAAADCLREAIQRRENILIVGSAGSGKTTLANACLAERAFCHGRIVIIEDTRELQSLAEDLVELVASPLSGNVSMDDLVRTTLRLFPDRIVVGEVRAGAETLSMLKAWATGHPGGLCTLHANGPRDALYRVEDLVGEVSATVPRRTIASAVGLVVFIERGDFPPAGRKVTALSRPRLEPTGDYDFDDVAI